MTRKTEDEFLDAVEKLVRAVNDYLNASDGCDDHRILAMQLSVEEVVQKAPVIPGRAV
jgi:hypothetical protein